MFGRYSKVYFVEIPKNASRSVCEQIERANGIHVFLNMHMKTSEALASLGDYTSVKPEKYVAVMRDPVDRLYSMAKFLTCHLGSYDLDTLLQKIADDDFEDDRRTGGIHFMSRLITRPQTYFLDGGVTYNLFTMQTIDKLCSFCGLGQATVMNESPQECSLDEVKRSKYFDRALQVYENDFWLYDLVSKNQTDEGYVWTEKELEECM